MLRKLKLQLTQDGKALDGELLDFGRVPIGESKTVEIRGVNLEKGDIEHLALLMDHKEVTVKTAIPATLKSGDDFYAWLTWQPSQEAEKGLTLTLTFEGVVVFKPRR